MLVIPAIDLRRGRCVRLLRGQKEKETVYGDDPVLLARRWREEGAEFLHVVDLDGAFEGRPVQQDLIRDMVGAVNIPVQVGGGVRRTEAVETYLGAGVQRVIIGTRALEDPAWLAELCLQYPGRICAGADATDGKVAIRGWVEKSELSCLELAGQLTGKGLRAVIYTDVSRDGTLDGPNVEAISRFAEAVDAPVIASGGIASLEDVTTLARLPLEGMIIGRALYTGDISLPEAIEAARAP